MPVQLTKEGMKQIYPGASDEVLGSFTAAQNLYDNLGITHTRPRLANLLANIDHETRGLTVKNLEENMNYSAERLPVVWPRRFNRRKYPDAKDPELYAHNPKKLANEVYGSRMGNRPGTDDGYNYRGRSGAQITGREAYREVGKRCGLPLEQYPNYASKPQHQGEIAGGFWAWKGLNPVADGNGVKAVRRIWNGGEIGLSDVERQYARILGVLKTMPGTPPAPEPTKEAVEEATRRERATVKSGVGVATAGGGAKTVETVAAPEKPQIPKKGVEIDTTAILLWSAIGIGVAVLVVGALLYGKKLKTVKENWF